MMSTINSDSTAKVNMTYDEVSDKFILTSKQTGAGNSIDISEASSTFMASVALDSGNANYTSGEDAQLILDGQNVTRAAILLLQTGLHIRC
jgi:flagellar hook-associated protein 2